MISDMFLAMAVLITAPVVLFLIMLLPSFLEFKKPKDPGPRLIIFEFESKTAQALNVDVGFLRNIEGPPEFQAKPVPNKISVLGFLSDIDI